MSAAASRRASITLALLRLGRGGATLRDQLAPLLEESSAAAQDGGRLEAAWASLAASAPQEVRARAEALDRRLQASGVLVLGLPDPAYPRSLRAAPDPPPALFLRGSLGALRRRSLGVGGSRRAPAPARGLGACLGRLARRAGLTLVGGWTSSCEEAAVVGALAGGGSGAVVLVQPYGPELPAGAGGILRRVLASGGAVVSAWPPEVPPRGRAHPRRSQLLGRLVDDMVVLRAGPSSGALGAVREALAAGADVWRPTWSGCGLDAGVGEDLSGPTRPLDHPLQLIVPELGGIPWRPRETRRVEARGPLAPDRLLLEEKSSPRRIERLLAAGWLAWTPDGRIGPGFEPILEAMTQRVDTSRRGHPGEAAPSAPRRASVLA